MKKASSILSAVKYSGSIKVLKLSCLRYQQLGWLDKNAGDQAPATTAKYGKYYGQKDLEGK